MSITTLAPLDVPGHTPSSTGNEEHPMRVMTKRAAGLIGPPWGPDAVTEVKALFDTLAPEWHTRSSPERTAVVADALERGLAGHGGGTALEVGSGIGAYSALVGERFDRVVSVDLSMEMLHRAPATALRVRGDASRLPVPGASADAVVLINMFLFPDEVDRVLAPAGVLVWVNSSGDQTPIHLAPDEVEAALPGAWTGVQSRAGAGLWAALHRA